MTEWYTLMTGTKDTGLWWRLYQMLFACCVFYEVAEELLMRHGYFSSGDQALGFAYCQFPCAGIRCMPLHLIFYIGFGDLDPGTYVCVALSDPPSWPLATAFLKHCAQTPMCGSGLAGRVWNQALCP